MAEYVKFRWTTAKVGASMALLALIAGVAEAARNTTDHVTATPAASVSLLKLTGLSKTISRNFLKVEQKLLKIESSITGLEKSITRNYYKATQINAKFLKISDASTQYLKATAAANFLQGKGSVVSGALSSIPSSAQQLLSLPGGIIVVSVLSVPGQPGTTLKIHNASGAVQAIASDVPNAPKTLQTGDTLIPAVPTGEYRIQIFPGAGMPGVVSILIGLTPNPSTQQPEAVAQAFTGGV